MTPELSVIAPEREGPPPPDPGRAPAASSPGKPRRGPTAFASDDRLARRAGRGDADAFAAIFRRYERDLYRFCVGILGEPQDAHDAIQNTMVKVLKALPGERREIQLKPWLYRIAHNEAVELRRRRRQLEPLESGIADGAVSIEERAERSERLELLFRDMTDLPERQRAVLVMRELNGLEFGEIGAALGTSPSAVRQALYEARRCLQQMELGRHMDCDAVARVLSDEEGRLRGRRDVRAHLRQCPDCRRVRREVSRRKQALAAIPPLPAFSAAGIAKGAVAGSGAGGAGAAAGGAGAAAGLAGGAAAGPGLVKSVAGVLAIVAVGTAAADRGGLADLPGGPRGTPVEREAGAAEPARRDASASGPARGEAGGPRAAGVAPASALPRSSARAAASGAGDRSVRGGRATRIGPASSEPVGTPPSRGDPAAATAAPRQGATAPAAQPTVATPERGSATGDRSPTARPERPARPEQPARPAQPAAEEKAERASQPEPQGNGKAPEANARGRRPEPKGTGRASPPSVPTAPPAAASEPPARPQRAPHPEQSRQEPAAAAPAEPTPAAVEPAPTAAPVAAPPGNGKGNANGAAAGNGPPGKEASALPE